MARTYKQPSIVSGLSVTDIVNMDNRTFNKLSASDLRKVTGRLVSAGNKRFRSLVKSGYSTPATRRLEESGGALSTVGKSLNELRSEFSRAKSFLQSDTSTKAGYIATRDDALKKLAEQKGGVDVIKAAEQAVEEQLKAAGKSVKSVGKREYKKMREQAIQERADKLFRAYEELKNVSPDVANRGLKYATLKDVADIIEEDPDATVDSIVSVLTKQLEKVYEEQAAQNGDIDISSFFEM